MRFQMQGPTNIDVAGEQSNIGSLDVGQEASLGAFAVLACNNFSSPNPRYYQAH